MFFASSRTYAGPCKLLHLVTLILIFHCTADPDIDETAWRVAFDLMTNHRKGLELLHKNIVQQVLGPCDSVFC